MAKLSDNAAFKSIVDELHNKVMQDFATYPNLTNVAVDIALTYKRIPGTTNATITVKAAERRSDYSRQSVGTVVTTT